MTFQADPHARWVLVFRWVVFLLAAGFCLRQLVFAADYGPVGGPFRYLTIWALLLSFFCASRMLALSERRSDWPWPKVVAVTAVANGLTVLIYWRLWFEDPALINSGGPLPWWLDYYLHGLGPLLQWMDALLIYGAFRRWWRAVPLLLGFTLAYVLWVEMFVGPHNDFPVGMVTDGLPYPFLNAMEVGERVRFYAVTAGTGLAMLVGFAGLAWVVRWVRAPTGQLN